MTKKSSESSQPERLVSMTLEDIVNTPLTEKQRAVLQRIKESQDAGDDSDIDFSDIPPLTEEQLANAYRPRDRQLISVHLDKDIVQWLKSDGEGYSVRLNNILRTVMQQQS